jgi:hypothetical protein
MVITVGARVFMPESNHMPQLMNHNTKLVTVLPNGNCLWSIATLPNKGTASATGTDIVVKLSLHIATETDIVVKLSLHILSLVLIFVECILSLYVTNKTIT